LTGNTINNNGNHGICIKYGNTNIIDANECKNNINDGISLRYSDGNSITNNDFLYNNEGILFEYSDSNTVFGNTCNNNSRVGLYLRDSDGNTLTNNEACNNINDAGIYLGSCRASSLNNNIVSDNTVMNNKNGIYISSSSYNYIGTGNVVNENTQYGIYLSSNSDYNVITGNTIINNSEYGLCYDNDCEDNTYENNGVDAVKLGSQSSGPGGFNPDYIFPLLFIIFFFSIIGVIGYVSIKRRKKLKEEGIREQISEAQPRVVFVRPGLIIREQSESTPSNKNDLKSITPKEIEPYEFYCSKCEQKSLGYQVFCPNCGERMRQPKLAKMHDPKEKVQCVICFKTTCSTCDHEITGEDACFEECPYCERSYHKHCWDKTIEVFGKCGFCLETPPPELKPHSFKSKSEYKYYDN